VHLVVGQCQHEPLAQFFALSLAFARQGDVLLDAPAQHHHPAHLAPAAELQPVLDGLPALAGAAAALRASCASVRCASTARWLGLPSTRARGATRVFADHAVQAQRVRGHLDSGGGQSSSLGLEKACKAACEQYVDLKKQVAREKANGNKVVAQ